MKKKYLILCALPLLMSGCVTQKKYNDMLNKKVLCDAALADCDKLTAEQRASIDSLKAQIADFQSITSELKSDTLRGGAEYRRLKSLYEDEAAINERLKNDYKQLLANSTSESGKLSQNLAKRERELLDLETGLQKVKAENEELSKALAIREARVKELQKILDDKEEAVKRLKNSVSNALLGFNDKDLTVDIRNGKVYVSLAEQLLFKSGSREVDKKGVEALRKLAGAIKNNPDINIMVEGHTDDVPWTKGSQGLEDNWDLSVLRATAIVRILQQAGVPPKHMTPAGKGEYWPIDSDKTKEARQKNRRTEIILTPKLDELFKILE